MSKRRAPRLLARHLKALEHLPAVLEALEALREEHGKVMALTGVRTPHPVVVSVPGLSPADLAAIRANDSRPRPGADHGNATLDTPERQEYEAAKREGRTVPDPFADPFRNATPEQRERMAEQRAAIAAEKARRGLARIPLAPTTPGAEKFDQVVPDEDVVVRTEELATGANGSFGAAVSVTATDERLSPEDES